MNDSTKAKIIEAVPEIMARVECDCYYCAQREHNGGGGHYLTGRPITFADVLRAIEKEKRGDSLKSPNLKRLSEFSGVVELLDMWHMALHYDGQTQKVKEFVGKLLNI